jgi:hypothetical protein
MFRKLYNTTASVVRKNVGRIQREELEGYVMKVMKIFPWRGKYSISRFQVSR